jgi:signal transduction histidine kinase
MQTRSHGIDLGLYTYPTELADKDLVVLADPTRLTQILVNLLSNSTRVLENHIGDRSCNIHCHVLTKPPDIAAFQSGTDKALQSIDENHYIKPDIPYGTDVWIMFLVRDSGPGMSAELQGRLFTRFNQVQGVNTGETSHSNSGGGAGLGLYLAKM